MIRKVQIAIFLNIVLLISGFFIISVESRPSVRVDDIIIGDFKKVGTLYPKGSPLSLDSTVTQVPFNPFFSHAFLNAVDLGNGARPGTQVLATHDGVVINSNQANCSRNTPWPLSGNGYGCHYIIAPEEGADWATYYGHCRQLNSNLQLGTQVKAGDYICDMGNSGFSFGAHLHYEFRCNTGTFCTVPIEGRLFELKFRDYEDGAFFVTNGSIYGSSVPGRIITR